MPVQQRKSLEKVLPGEGRDSGGGKLEGAAPSRIYSLCPKSSFLKLVKVPDREHGRSLAGETPKSVPPPPAPQGRPGG